MKDKALLGTLVGTICYIGFSIFSYNREINKKIISALLYRR